MNIFEQTLFNEEIKKAINDLGFVEPTPIQVETIPYVLNTEDDLIALAQTGTGKTAAFGFPILQMLDFSKKNTQAIILSPTRELAIQITKDLENYAKYIKNVRIVAVYGGASIDNQIRDLKKGANIIVGTPGRTLDLIKRKTLNIEHIKWLVLDEADEMLNMGFREDLDAILENTPSEKRTLLFSATMPDGVRQIADTYLNIPKEIAVGKKNKGAENVEHHLYVVRASDRYLALKRLADYHPSIYGIIFCRTRAETKEVASKLMDDGYNADALHGDLSQAQRDYVMQRFRTSQLQLLVATDVAARGLDIDDLTHIINYNLPDDPEVYIHRSGRTGRAGKNGISIIISHTREGNRIRNIERIVGKKFETKKIPTGEEICEKRLFNLMDKMEQIVVNEEKIAPYIEQINKKLQWLDRDELLKRFVYVQFERFLDYYKNAKDLNVEQSKTRERERETEKSGRRGRIEYSRFFINIGSKNNLKPPNLLGLINEVTASKDIVVGKIDIQRNFSFFEVEKDAEEIIIESFENKTYGNLEIKVEKSEGDTQKTDRYKKDRNYGDKYKKDKYDKDRNSGDRKNRDSNKKDRKYNDRKKDDNYKKDKSNSDRKKDDNHKKNSSSSKKFNDKSEKNFKRKNIKN